MAIQLVVSSRANYPIDTYIGDRGQLFYNQNEGDLRLSDGVTPGGLLLTFPATFDATTITLQPELAPEQNSGDNYLLIYDVSTGTLKKATLDTLFSQGAGIGYTGSRGEDGRGIATLEIIDDELVVRLTDDETINLGNIRGPMGYTGSGGGGGQSNLVFSAVGDQRILSGYVDPTGETYPVRTAELTNGVFKLNLAAFTPVLSSSVLPSGALSWDQPSTGFTVSVGNPTDFTTSFISQVRSITALTGAVINDISLYTTSGPSATPSGGTNWNQTFTTNSQAFIRSTSTTIAGGTASALISFNSITDDVETEFTGATATWTVTWATPTLSVVLANLSGNIFLQTYAGTAYTISVSGMSSAANYELSVSAQGGTPTNLSNSGQLNFTEPLHKNNVSATRSVSVSGQFNRPLAVSGSAYSASLTASSSTFAATFTYPSFWIFTANVNTPPVREAVVTSSSFNINATVLANQARTFSGFVNNTQNVPRVFWFGIRTSATQPTVFQTGASSSLLSDVLITTSSVQLAPDTVPVGYLAENYNLYGIILQPGNTYVNIS